MIAPILIVVCDLADSGKFELTKALNKANICCNLEWCNENKWSITELEIFPVSFVLLVVWYKLGLSHKMFQILTRKHFSLMPTTCLFHQQVWPFLGSGGGRCPSTERFSLNRFGPVWSLECHDHVQREACAGGWYLEWEDPRELIDRYTRLKILPWPLRWRSVIILFTKIYVATEFIENILWKLKLFLWNVKLLICLFESDKSTWFAFNKPRFLKFKFFLGMYYLHYLYFNCS